MNDRPDDVLLEPTDERMSEIRDGIFHDVIAARNAERAYNRERSRAGWWVGGIGAAIGVLACGALTAVAIYAKPVRIYTVIDSAAGVIYDSYGAQDAPAHFGWLSAFVGLDMPASSALTQQRLAWKPTGPGLIADLEQMHY